MRDSALLPALLPKIAAGNRSRPATAFTAKDAEDAKGGGSTPEAPWPFSETGIPVLETSLARLLRCQHAVVVLLGALGDLGGRCRSAVLSS
jgi:hypothetical protein